MTISNGKHDTRTLKFETGNYVYLTDSMSNCKLTSVDYVGSLYGYNNITNVQQDKEFILKLKEVLTQCRILVHINIINERIAKLVQDNFECYESIKIPVGYGGYQYHIFIKNGKGGCARDIEKKPEYDKATIKEKLTVILKKKRRKTDIVKDLIDSL